MRFSKMLWGYNLKNIFSDLTWTQRGVELPHKWRVFLLAPFVDASTKVEKGGG